MDDLYSELIVDHYKNPRGFGEIEGHTHKGRGANASCGDMVEFYVKVNDKNEIEEVSFKGVGCAMSTASASMLVEKVKSQKLKIEDIQAMTAEDLQEMMGIEISPTRMKCVSLPLRVLKDILEAK